jgi:hypothetical protein
MINVCVLCMIPIINNKNKIIIHGDTMSNISIKWSNTDARHAAIFVFTEKYVTTAMRTAENLNKSSLNVLNNIYTIYLRPPPCRAYEICIQN